MSGRVLEDKNKIELKTGEIVSKVKANAVWHALDELYRSDGHAFDEVVQAAQDEAYRLCSSCIATLVRVHLIQGVHPNNSAIMADVTRSVILSAVVDNGRDFSITSPFKGD